MGKPTKQNLNRSTRDVIIVGGGHVGLYAASRLAEAGFETLLFDQKKEIGSPVICTGIIGDEAFRKFDLPEITILGQIRQVRFYSPSDNYFDYAPKQTLAWVVNRTRFNRYFADQAARRGAAIETGCRVTGIRIKKDSVSVRVFQHDKESSYEAKVLILATGVNYKLFEWVGLEPPSQFLLGAQIHIPYPAEDRTTVYLGREVAPGAFAWIVPMTNGQARVGLLSERNPAHYLKRLLDRIRPGWRDDIAESQMDLRPVVQGPVEKSFSDRVLVIGEAAGQIKTTTGGGIYYGLLGAQMAVETLKDAFRKSRFHANVLSPYERRWKKAIGEELRLGVYFRKLYAKLSDAQIEGLFERVSTEHILNIAHREADFDWHKSLITSIFKIPSFRKVFRQPF
ncbi:MAG TPA: NAD(P)/FAD-dependent oxidoreductase [bacterium]|nr:NAD(P)/FAD-dependent oxidoreductase [bacterium]